jgi:hypothetical protein
MNISINTLWPSIIILLWLGAAATGAAPEILILIAAVVIQVGLIIYRVVDFTVGEAKARSAQDFDDGDN